MTFEERLENYATQPNVLRKNKDLGEGGLTPKQSRRLLKKDRHQWSRSQEGETTK
jgi:hypothetical protein